jgi:hypothetical protein
MTIVEITLEIMLEAITPYKKKKINKIDIFKEYEFINNFHSPNIDNPILFGIENIEFYGKHPIRIDYYFSEKGKIIVLNESGEGFNFMEIQNKFENKQKYFLNKGEGFRVYNLPYFFVSAEENATQLNFLKLF